MLASTYKYMNTRHLKFAFVRCIIVSTFLILLQEEGPFFTPIGSPSDMLADSFGKMSIKTDGMDSESTH